MPLRIIRNDITLVAADAVVNPANPLPCIGAGTDAAIHAAAGPELLAARRRIGDIAPGCCAATPAFALPARYVLHTVGPRWIDGEHGEPATLRRAYLAALELASELGCADVAVPLLGAGSYGTPHDAALSVAVGAITDFLMDHELTVILVLFNGKAFGLAGALFDDLKSYIDDHYVELRHREEQAAPSGPFRGRGAQRLRQNRPTAEETRMPEDYSVSRADEMPFMASMPAPCAGVCAARQEESLPDVLSRSEATFSEYLLDLLRERQGKDSEVYKRAEISKQLFSKILSTKNYQPTKSTVLQLAIGLQLDLSGTQKLLERAGYALTRSSKTDIVVQYYIERSVYSVTFINEALSDCGLPLLKTGLKS